MALTALRSTPSSLPMTLFFVALLPILRLQLSTQCFMIFAVSLVNSLISRSSLFFFAGCPSCYQNQIKTIFPVSDLLLHTMHLGHPIIFYHSDRNKAYEFIFNKFRAKLNVVKVNKLNHAGGLTYIKSVPASIPFYYMSTVLVSKTFIGKINTIIRRVWWARV